MNYAKTHWAEIVVSVALLALIFVPRTTDLALFQGHDETMRNRQSVDSYVALVEGRWGDVYSSNFGATNLTWAQTAYRLFHYARLRLAGQPVTLAGMAHYGPDFNPLPGALFNAVQLVILYWFLRKLLDWPTAALATALMALDPYLLSEARILRTEAAFAAFITLTAVSLALYAHTRRRVYLAWAGVWLAWTMATKVSGVVLGPAALLVLVGMLFTPAAPAGSGPKLKQVAVDGLILGAVAAAATVLIWPTLWVQPLQTLTDLRAFLLDWSQTDVDLFYRGQIVTVLPAAYYGLILLYKTTPLVWLGLVAFGWAAWRSRREPADATAPRWGGFTFPAAGGLIVLLCAGVYILFMAASEFKTERYMMAAVSNFDVVAAIGLMALAQLVWHRWQVKQWPQPVFWAGMAAVLVLGHGLLTWLNHPYYFSYYNPLLGGGVTAVKTVQIGSGEVIDRAIAYLNQQPNPKEQVVVCGTNLPRCEYQAAGQTFLNRNAFNRIYGEWVAADYVVTYIFQTQRGDYPPGVIEYLDKQQPIHTLTFQGIDYATVYPAPAAQFVAASELTGLSTLLGYNLNTHTLAAGDDLTIDYYLENDGQTEHNLFVRLVDADYYIWSETSAEILPDYQPLTRQRGAILPGRATLKLPVGMPPGQYFLKMGYQTAAGQLVGEFQLPSDGDTVEVSLPQHFTEATQPAQPLQLNIDDALQLTGFNLAPAQLTGGPAVWLTLHWQASADVQRDYVINLRLLNAAGDEVAYWLGRPVYSGYPTNQWRAGQVVQDPWRVTLPEEAPAGQYRLELALFDAETQQQVLHTTLQQITLGDVQSP